MCSFKDYEPHEKLKIQNNVNITKHYKCVPCTNVNLTKTLNFLILIWGLNCEIFHKIHCP
jgi:hypothetical protein